MSSKPAIAAIIVMGVSGSGKTTIAKALASRLDVAEEDGDSFHPPANVAKMHAGSPLTDDDRWPWLAAIAAAIDRNADAGRPIVVACSALKRAYRHRLIHDRADVRLVYLKGSRELIASRLAERRDHFMPASLLDSQFATLEEPEDDEPAVAVNIDRAVTGIVDDIMRKLELCTMTAAP